MTQPPPATVLVVVVKKNDNMASGAAAYPFGLSQIPGDPSFRNSAVNPVAVIPLLSTDNEGNVTASRSVDSFRHLLTALQRHTKQAEGSSATAEDELVLVIPNSSLTRPGDWRYSDTPLKAFHWQHGCQRVAIFDGRPDCSRQAHDRLMNHGMTRDWIDLCPSRRTAAVVGVLNMHDCRETKDLQLAEEELHRWAERYATPPYEVTAHGRNVARDQPVMRLFVYDSFDEEVCQKIDLTKSSMGNSVLAFPPTDEAHAQMMDLHLNVVINDLAVAIFRDLETMIGDSDAICSSASLQVAASAQASSSSARRSLTRIISGSSDGKEAEQEPAQSGRTLTLSSMAGLVSPDSKLAQESPRANIEDGAASEADTAANVESNVTPQLDEKAEKTPQKRASEIGEKPPLKPASASTPLLLTPLDEYWEPAELSGRDVDAIRKRDLGRREKFAADLSLLAGSPLDAYERYLKAAELCKSGTLDPLWYASSIEGCACAHIAMAECGGYSIDEYLDNNFQLPDELMALVKKTPEEKRQAPANKQTLPDIVFALCQEALNIVNRHPKLAPYHAELLLKLAWYTADLAQMHLRCRWGEGPTCYRGEPSDPPRWERTSVYNLQIGSFKGDNPVSAEAIERTKRVCEFLHQATALRTLDPATRVDVASQAIVLCLQGVKRMDWGKVPMDPIVLPRKAAFFAAVAADSVSNDSFKHAGKLWLLATQLYSRNGGPTYGWGALRAACLSALSTRGNNVLSLEASEQLLSLLCELDPEMTEPKERSEEKIDTPTHVESEERGIAELSAHGSSATPKGEQEGISSTANLFAKQLRESYHQIKATSAFLAQESKWAYDEALPPQVIPLGDTSMIGSTLSSLKCVWTTSDLNRCAAAQSQCMNRVSVLRRSLPTPSSPVASILTIYGSSSVPTVPLYVVSAKAIDAESQLEVQKIDVASPETEKGAMATFFNPFEKRRLAGGSKGVTSVAEGEERAFSVEFGNRLAVPLEISRCQLEFRGRGTSRVKATSLSFVIPPKSKAFTISFPFTVLPRSVAPNDDLEQGEEFEVNGVDLTCLGRSFSLPIKPGESGLGKSSTSFPVPTSDYAWQSKKKEDETSAPTCFPIQAYPCQPSLHIFYADSHTPFESFTINLADGELYTSPPLLLECYAGPSGHGNVEQLEVHLSGLTAASQKLFDTSSAEIPQSNEEFIGEVFGKEASQPLRVRVVAENFSLSAVNGRRDKGARTDNKLRIQALASHMMARRLEKDTQLQLRFRYRGQTNKLAQVWRNHEIPVKIKLSKGPRITCLSFKPTIHLDCYFRELASKLERKDNGSSEEVCVSEEELVHDRIEKRSIRVGQHSSANVCSEEVGVLVTVLNETRSEVELSREGGALGNLGKHQFGQVIVRPSVSVKIPMILKRLELTDHTIVLDDLVEQLVTSTKLVWKGLDAAGGEAFGQVRIHPDCLKQLIHDHPSIVSKVCSPPCSVAVLVNGSAPEHAPMVCSLGSPGAEVGVKVNVADWVSQDERNKCEVRMELICASEKDDVEPSGRAHVWAGKVRHKSSMSESPLDHRARVIFCSPGTYIVSACVRITREFAKSKGVEEIWMAPFAQRIVVKRADVPSQ